MSTVLFRSVVLYFLLIFAIRFSGKRQIGELQPIELVLTIMISNFAVMPIEDTGIPLTAGIIPILTVVSLEVIISYLTSVSPMLDRLFTGKPIVLIENGKIQQKTLRQLRISPSDLTEKMRQNQIFNIDETDIAIMETGGNISFSQTDESQQNPQVQIIENGRINPSFLNYCGITEKWVFSTLKKEKTHIKDVYLMTCSKDRKYTIVRKESN